MGQSETSFKIGEDLYAISVAELEGRLVVLKDEISRLEIELDKKKRERDAADSLFDAKP